MRFISVDQYQFVLKDVNESMKNLINLLRISKNEIQLYKFICDFVTDIQEFLELLDRLFKK